jgi:putative endonuclease
MNRQQKKCAGWQKAPGLIFHWTVSRRIRHNSGMGRQYYVYIMTNKGNTVLYTGVTGNLERRVYEHKHKITGSFTAKYNINKLVYYEATSDINAAIAHEKKVKRWRRAWKEEMIAKKNPEWRDLSEGWYSDEMR